MIDQLPSTGFAQITPERIKRWSKQFKQMKNFGLNIPTPWGHLQKAYPGYSKDNASNNDNDYETREFMESKFNAGYVDDLDIEIYKFLIEVIIILGIYLKYF
jgi:hypothetical protein